MVRGMIVRGMGRRRVKSGFNQRLGRSRAMEKREFTIEFQERAELAPALVESPAAFSQFGHLSKRETRLQGVRSPATTGTGKGERLAGRRQ